MKQDSTVFIDEKKAPHIIISGTTGSNKSKFLHEMMIYMLRKEIKDNE